MTEESNLIVSFLWDKSTVCLPGMIKSLSLPYFLSLGALSLCKIRKFSNISFILIIQYGNLIKSQIEKKEEIIYILGG
jgi:hypothetical protein